MESEAADDSLYIVYENLAPDTEIQIVDVIGGVDFPSTAPQLQEVPVIDISEDSLVLEDFAGYLPEHATGAGASPILQLVDDQVKDAKEKSSKEEKNVAAPTRNNKMKLELECGICLDTMNEIVDSAKNLVSTVCGHVFCNVCMKASRLKSPLCPVCRKPLGETQIHPLYF